MTTAEDIFNKAIVILDELTETGDITDSQISEYKHRAPYLLDMFQGNGEIRDLYKTFEISFTRKQNLLGISITWV